jgi:anti-sigma B factor antagonist
MTFQRNDHDDQTTLIIEGSLDALSAPDIRPTIESLVSERRTKVIVDLSSLRLIDSSGVGALVSLYKRVKAQGGDVTIVGVRDQPLAIFKLLRLQRMLGTSSPVESGTG